jgi:hypothetical protein
MFNFLKSKPKTYWNPLVGVAYNPIFTVDIYITVSFTVGSKIYKNASYKVGRNHIVEIRTYDQNAKISLGKPINVFHYRLDQLKFTKKTTIYEGKAFHPDTKGIEYTVKVK